MTVAGSARVSGDVEGLPRPRRRMVMVLVLAGAVAFGGVWQWRSPDVFLDQGSEVTMRSHVGTTALLGIATPIRNMDPAVLTVHSVDPRVIEGSAQVDVLVCHPRPRAGGIGTAEGEGALNRFCESHEAPGGARLAPGDDLILRVHSEEPGRVVVKGIKVTYSHGWRRGSQVTGLTAKVIFGTETVRGHLDGG